MSQKQSPNYLFPLIIVFIVCFLIGFITTMNNSMIAFLSQAFDLSAQQGQYVNTAFYGAYLLAIPFAMLMSKIGYKATLLLGLAVAGVGFVINSFGINWAPSPPRLSLTKTARRTFMRTGITPSTAISAVSSGIWNASAT